MKASSIAFLTLVFLFAGAGSYIGNTLDSDATSPLLLHAKSAEKKSNFSIGTGLINSDCGGFYSLDHETGELQCKMIEQRTNKVIGTFRANVTEDMQFDKVGERNYLMKVSYVIDHPKKHDSYKERLGDSTCFIAETITGRVIAYRVSYDKRLELGKRYQDGKFKGHPSFLLRSSKTRGK